MGTEKFCVDCKHYSKKIGAPDYMATCTRYAQKPNIVTGEQVLRACSIVRMADNPCGPEGRGWEPKEPEAKPDRGGFLAFFILGWIIGILFMFVAGASTL